MTGLCLALADAFLVFRAWKQALNLDQALNRNSNEHYQAS